MMNSMSSLEVVWPDLDHLQHTGLGEKAIDGWFKTQHVFGWILAYVSPTMSTLMHDAIIPTQYYSPRRCSQY